MYYLDLFSGIGGFHLGAKWAGMEFDKTYFSEVEPYAIDVYKKRFPGSIPLGDIRNIRGKELPKGEWILSGGFPCQDISVAGKGAGLEGERSGLWYEYARLIGELRPRYCIMENVGALTFRGLDAVLGSLAALGYDAEWQDIRASDVGAPHRRERIWIVAYPNARDAERRQGERHRIWGEEVGERSDDNSCRSSAPFVHVADPSGERCRETRELRYDEFKKWFTGRGEAMADASEYGCGQWWTRGLDSSRARESEQALFDDTDADREPMGRSTEPWCQCSQWSVEPDVGRVAHGVPARVDRLKCLGNSIVPQIAELIFVEIKKEIYTLQ